MPVKTSNNFVAVFLATSPLLIFFGMMIWIAFYIMPINIDLSRFIKTTGTITSVNKEVDHSSKSLGLSNLVIHAKGWDNGFGLYRTFQNYNGLISRLKPGSQVVIYHDEVLHNNNYEIYQLENTTGIIYSFTEYKWTERAACMFILIVDLVFFRLTLWKVYKAALRP